ncbi:MAG: c-type cytochrome [Myxococcaceae bacterium]|jgi:DNA-binding beta-propeller fold protein YncE/mono/diheme cytochrome c family protein|nr:c-type cytochrome [Myxococcaceae bacterium]
MKTRLLAAALAFATALACAPEAPAGGGNSASGSVAISRDDALVYAVDADLDTLFVVDAKDLSAEPRAIKVGRMPEKVLVAPDDTVYVANRYGRSVSVVRRGDSQASLTLEVGVEPVGLAVSEDGRTLYVVNSTRRTDLEVGSVMAFDTATHTLKWETAVGPEPRAITLLPGGRAMVTLYKSGDVVMLDVTKGAVTKSGSDLFRELNRSALGLSTPNGQPRQRPGTTGTTGPSTRRARALEAVTASPDGKQVYVAALLATDSVLNTRPNDPLANGGGSAVPGGFGGGAGNPGTSAGYGSSGGGCRLVRPVAAASLLTFDPEGNANVDDASADDPCRSFVDPNRGERPPLFLTSNAPGIPVQGPAAIAVDASGGYVFVANRESNNVSIVPTTSITTAPTVDRNLGAGGTQVVNVGAGPTGIAVSRDGTTAWVFNAFDHSLSKLSSGAGIVRQREVKRLAEDVLPADVVAGRKLFFSAVSPDMNDPNLGISCATCHVEAREDGHVWNTTEGPRNTPALTGKLLAKTAPFHWNGEFNTVSQFMSHTTKDRMGGRGPSEAMERQLMAFIMSVQAPDNPFTTETPADVKARGKSAWDKAACGTCHRGEALTDDRFYDVGTLVETGPVVDRREFLFHGGLNTPSLLGIARTGPFLHDGSAPTLKARILMGKERNEHGLTSQLTDQEVDDLVAYVRSL